MNTAEEILTLIDMLGLEVSRGILTTTEAAELLTYGFITEC